jgi:hypothetical protein
MVEARPTPRTSLHHQYFSSVKIQVARTGDDMDGQLTTVVADAAGKFSIKVDKPGAYLAMTRHRIAPSGGQAGRSLTYSLTFEATGAE